MASGGSHKNLAFDKSYKRYLQQFQQSEGFDVDRFPALRGYEGLEGLVLPVPDWPSTRTYLTGCAKSSIEHFNELNGTAYELVEVLKATHAVIRGTHYRITFVAKQKDEDPKTFQVYLVCFMWNIDYEFVRIKPPALPQQTSKSFDVGLMDVHMPMLADFAKSSIERYNKLNGTAFEFVKVLKATHTVIRGTHYRITFVANQKDEDPKTFQVYLIYFLMKIYYEFVRLKPPALAQQTSKVPNKRKLMLTSMGRGWRLRAI